MKKIISIICACACAFAFTITSITPINAATSSSIYQGENVIIPRTTAVKYVAEPYSKMGTVVTITYTLTYDDMTGQLYDVSIFDCRSTLIDPCYSKATLVDVKLTGKFSAQVKVKLEKKCLGVTTDYVYVTTTIYS